MKRKSVWASVLCLALLASVLAGCGGARSSAQDGWDGEASFGEELPGPDLDFDPEPAGETLNVVCPEFSLSDGFIVPVQQRTEVPEGYIPIYNEEEFSKISLNPSGCYILMNDLDLANIVINEDDAYYAIDEFTGIFDGNGHSVTNYCFPFVFTYLYDGGMVLNLEVRYSGEFELPFMNWEYLKSYSPRAKLNSYLPNYFVSGIVAVMGKGAVLENCFTSGVMKVEEKPSSYYDRTGVAGLVCYASNSSISSCYNGCDIEAGDGVDAAGIIYYAGSSTSVGNCFNTGNITAGYAVAGIAYEMSSNNDDAPTTISSCYNTGDLRGVRAAGIVYHSNGGLIYRCFNGGNISASGDACGIGDAGDVISCYNYGNIDGLTVYGIGDRDARCCYNAGSLSASDGAPGAIGRSGGAMQYCYFLDNVADATPEGALYADVKRLTDEEMRREESFQGFDFENEWRMGDGDYPYPVFHILPDDYNLDIF